MKSAVIFGATGLIGSKIVQRLSAKGYKVTVVSRDISKAKEKLKTSGFQPLEFLSYDKDIELTRAINNSSAVINLAGAGLFDKRWSKGYKELLFASRINTTKKIVKLMSKAKVKPKVFISGSAVGFYGGNLSDKELDENAPSGFDFLAQICTFWENEANKAKNLGVRIVNLRTGIVFSNDGGTLPRLSLLSRFKIGNYFAPGNQYMSWIDIDDLAEIILYLIEGSKISGPVNATSPNALTHKELALIMKRLYRVLLIIPIPAFIAKIVIGDAAKTFTTGQRVIPKKLLDKEFKFKYPNVEDSIRKNLKVGADDSTPTNSSPDSK